MKIVTVVGARPQFIKVAALSRILRKRHHEILIHTGQHYDTNMSDIFFNELEIPYPDYNLGINGGTHAQMTAKMMVGIEEVLLKEKPDALLVYGDTNSTVAAALTSAKLQIPIIHVEAAIRLGSRSNPEEINRIVTDHLSSILFACVPSSMEFAKKEGLIDKTYLVGDPMYDAFLYYKEKKPLEDIKLISLDNKTVKVPKSFNYLTIHRQENTQKDQTLYNILLAMEKMESPTIYPVHPRNQEIAKKLKENNDFKNILFVEPVGYLESNTLINKANKIVTDSGGVQREAFFAQKPCITVFDFIVWPETMVNNCNQLAKAETDDILSKSRVKPTFDENYYPFGKGDACNKIVDVLNTIEFKP